MAFVSFQKSSLPLPWLGTHNQHKFYAYGCPSNTHELDIADKQILAAIEEPPDIPDKHLPMKTAAPIPSMYLDNLP